MKAINPISRPSARRTATASAPQAQPSTVDAQEPKVVVASDESVAVDNPDSQDDDRIVIEQAVGETGRVVHLIDAVLEGQDVPTIFQAGGALVRVGKVPPRALSKLLPEHRSESYAAIRQVTQADLRSIVSRVIRFQRWNPKRDRWDDSEPWPAVLSAYLDAHGEWGLPALRGLSSAPLMRSDGTVDDVQGYDPGTGMFSISDVRLELPATITREDAIAAFGRAMEPFCNFPFATDVDRAVFAAYLLGLVVRPMIAMQPAVVIGAPTYGSGKTKLAVSAGLLVHGREPVVLAPRGHDRDSEPEMAKRIAALAALGVESVVLDNVVDVLSSPVLAAVLTQSVVTDRLLGRNDRMISGLRPTIAVTANNAEVGRDMVRRVLWCYLDPGVPNPELRGDFRYPDLEAHIRAHRPALLRDLYMALAGFMRAGRPPTFGTSLGSFEVWYSLVAECVGWLGLPDPVVSQQAVRAVDDEAADFDELVAAWHHLYGGDARESGEVFADAKDYLPIRPGEQRYLPVEEDPQQERMANALRRVGVDKPERLGVVLKSLANRAFDVPGVGVVRVRRYPTNRRRWQVA